jgi:hypothetical protein
MTIRALRKRTFAIEKALSLGIRTDEELVGDPMECGILSLNVF